LTIADEVTKGASGSNPAVIAAALTAAFGALAPFARAGAKDAFPPN
jgi:hypothetical protein